jgi:hypothetical protein
MYTVRCVCVRIKNIQFEFKIEGGGGWEDTIDIPYSETV